MINFKKFVFVMFILFLFTVVIESQDFSYSNEGRWKNAFPQCGLKRQSPIELWNSKYTIKQSLPPIRFKNYNKNLPTPIHYENNGHTINIRPKKTQNLPTISGVQVPGTFVFQHLHFHWGSQNNFGSEHTIRGKRFALEAHLVHKNIKYKTTNEALKHDDGFVVVAILYKANNSVKSATNGLENILINIDFLRRSSHNIYTNVSFKLQNLFRHIDPQKHFLYKGSLTTPPCAQVVTWIVMSEIESISNYQMDFFRKLVDNEGVVLSNNYRHLQKVGRRLVLLT